MKSRTATAVAFATALVLGVAACGGAANNNNNNTNNNTTPKFNAALTQVFNPSDKKGGTIKMANAGDWDTLDPGETYYGFSWNFSRNYGRSLVMFRPAPGKAGNELVPDLATSLGQQSDGGKTWTYKIRPGIKYEDGTVVTTKDIKHAVLRSTDKKTFPNGPAYFEQFLNLPAGWDGPYRSKNMDTNSAIETPDDTTIVFHLKVAFGGFDYLAQLTQTVPVPAAKDDGAKYRNHVLSTGPYKFEKVEVGKQYTLVRNPMWDQSTDPIRKALPDRWEISLNVNPDDIDNRLINGDLHIDVAGTGVQPAAQGRVLRDANLKARADNPTIARLWYVSVDPQIPPFDNIECRKAVLYAADRTGYQAAYGGPLAGGEVATTLMPPLIPGYQKFDLYPAGSDNKGDVDKAKAALTACGKPDGFSTNMAYRAERPKEKATAESLQQALGRVGIKLTLQPYPQGDYFAQFAGNPPFMRSHGIGLATNGWGADWPDGFGFLSQIVDSRVIRETGGSSNISVRIPEVDQMLDQALAETDKAKREAMWAQIDRRVMQEAVILPGVYAKSLLVRPQGLTNVFVSEGFNMYDYLALGVA